MNRNCKLALDLFLQCPDYVEDAREGAPRDNSIVGSLISLRFKIPRQYAEEGVRQALEYYSARTRILDQAKEKLRALNLPAEEARCLAGVALRDSLADGTVEATGDGSYRLTAKGKETLARLREELAFLKEKKNGKP